MFHTTTNSENLLLSHKHQWIFNFVTKIEIYLKESLQEIYEFRQFRILLFQSDSLMHTMDKLSKSVGGDPNEK